VAGDGEVDQSGLKILFVEAVAVFVKAALVVGTILTGAWQAAGDEVGVEAFDAGFAFVAFAPGVQA
jgi:hypothetical protein